MDQELSLEEHDKRMEVKQEKLFSYIT